MPSSRYSAICDIDDSSNADQSWVEVEAGIGRVKPRFPGAMGVTTFNERKKQVLARLNDMHSALAKCPGPEEEANSPGTSINKNKINKY